MKTHWTVLSVIVFVTTSFVIQPAMAQRGRSGGGSWGGSSGNKFSFGSNYYGRQTSSGSGTTQFSGNGYDYSARGASQALGTSAAGTPTYRNPEFHGSNQSWQPNVTTQPSRNWQPNNSTTTTNNYPNNSNYPNYNSNYPTYTPNNSMFGSDTPTYTTPQPNQTPAANVLPNQAPEPVVPVSVATNLPGGANVLSLTDSDIDSAKSQIADQNKQIADKLTDEIANDTIIEINNDPALAALPPDTKNSLLQAVKDGDFAHTYNILNANGLLATQGGKGILADASNVGDIKTLAKDASNGTATQQQLDKVAGALNARYNFPDAAGSIASLAANNKMAGLLQTAQPGSTTIPGGDDVPMMLVSGLPSDTIVSMGNGAVMIGTGGTTSGTIVGEGNVAEVAGLPVTIGPPVANSPDDATSSGVLLVNSSTSTLSYLVNDNTYTMAPGFHQELPAGQSWTIAFDRGGSNGEARYSLTDGTYDFAPGDHGWDLFKQKFSVALDNSLSRTPFNYVFDNQQQTVPPSRIMDLTSDYPVVVRFDNGKGQTQQKVLKSGTYQVATKPGAGIDLYPPDAIKPPVQGSSQLVGGKRLPAGFRLFDAKISVASTQSTSGGSSQGIKLFTK